MIPIASQGDTLLTIAILRPRVIFRERYTRSARGQVPTAWGLPMQAGPFYFVAAPLFGLIPLRELGGGPIPA